MEHNDVYELLEQVIDHDSFIEFVKALAEERKLARQIEIDNPQTYIIDGALSWSNADIASFLHAALAYFQDRMFHTPEKVPSWKMFADFLYFGKIYE